MQSKMFHLVMIVSGQISASGMNSPPFCRRSPPFLYPLRWDRHKARRGIRWITLLDSRVLIRKMRTQTRPPILPWATKRKREREKVEERKQISFAGRKEGRGMPRNWN